MQPKPIRFDLFLVWIPLVTMNVIVRAEQRNQPYALRSRRLTSNRFPLRSMSKSSASCEQNIRVLQPNSIEKNRTAIKPTEKSIVHYMSKIKFSTINDDCILHVLEHLSLPDLCSIAEVSVRFKQLAQYVFRVKYMNTELNMNLLCNRTEKITMKQARSLLYNFGQFIKILHVSRKDFKFDTPFQRPFVGQQKLFHLIGKYCSSLERLTIGHFWFNTDLIKETLPTFARLQTLNFYRVLCYNADEKTFSHFANILPLLLHVQTPQMVQLI